MANNVGLRQLSFNIGATFSRQFVGLVFGFLTASLIARFLGPTGNGLYTVAMLLPSFLTIFLSLGIGPANVYYVGRGSVALKTAIRVSIRLWLLITVIGAVISMVVIVFFAEQLIPGASPFILWIAFLSFPTSLLQTYLASLLQALQEFRRYNLSIMATPVIRFLFVLVFMVLGGNIEILILSVVLVQVINIAITYTLLKQIIQKGERDFDVADEAISSKDYAKRAVTYGYKAHINSIVPIVNYRIGIFFLNILINPTATGIYGIAVTMAEKLWLASQAVNTVILPRLAEIHKHEDNTVEITAFIARWVFVFSVIGAILLGGVSHVVIRVMFGEAYLGAVRPLILLLPGIVFANPAWILANDIFARGRPELNMYLAIFTVVANVLSSLIFIPMMGLDGAAISTTIAYCLHFVASFFVYLGLSQQSWQDMFRPNAYDQRVMNRLKRLIHKS
jgi:O-antigen/teichoic acid export membrane protein